MPIGTEDIHKTAICAPFGLFEITRMHIGVCNAARAFQIFINEVTRVLKGVYAFIDDMLITSQEHVQKHTTHLCAHFERLDYYGIRLKLSKCYFWCTLMDTKSNAPRRSRQNKNEILHA
ncbi:transposon Ty3-I Gag-Pol polyprotein [Trichonephila clavipes]|nr:transposon Ty3-I Gag-Pol polyprotein [Trichonephila clavipes]